MTVLVNPGILGVGTSLFVSDCNLNILVNENVCRSHVSKFSSSNFRSFLSILTPLTSLWVGILLLNRTYSCSILFILCE